MHRGTAQGQWLYESRAFPNLLARVAVSPDARQRSTMDIAQGTVRPQTLVFDDGSDSGVRLASVAGAGAIRSLPGSP